VRHCARDAASPGPETASTKAAFSDETEQHETRGVFDGATSSSISRRCQWPSGIATLDGESTLRDSSFH